MERDVLEIVAWFIIVALLLDVRDTVGDLEDELTRANREIRRLRSRIGSRIGGEV